MEHVFDLKCQIDPREPLSGKLMKIQENLRKIFMDAFHSFHSDQ